MTKEECIKALKFIQTHISKSELIRWFNDMDLDYYGMSDLEMYIYYLEMATFD